MARKKERDGGPKPKYILFSEGVRLGRYRPDGCSPGASDDIQIGMFYPDGSVSWGFRVEQVAEARSNTLRIIIYDDAFVAFSAKLKFFMFLSTVRPTLLSQIVEWLDENGYTNALTEKA